jgi:hypothetical protein
MASNPLKVLGIDPALLRGMNTNMARATVRAIAQAQLRVTHPDQGGDEHRFREVSEIQDLLKDNDAFTGALQTFLKPRKSQVEDLQQQNRKLKRLAVHHEQRAQAFALGLLSSQLTASHRISYEINLSDTVQADLNIGFKAPVSSFVSLSVAEDGGMKVKRRGKTTTSGRRLIGSIPRTENVPQLMLDSQPDRIDLLDNGGKMRQIGRTYDYTAPAPIGTNRVLVSNARPILRRLRPEIKEESYLFSALSIEGQDYLYFEGKVISIELGAESS